MEAELREMGGKAYEYLSENYSVKKAYQTIIKNFNISS